MQPQKTIQKEKPSLQPEWIGAPFGKLSPTEGWAMLFFTQKAFERNFETGESYGGVRRFAATYVAKSLDLGEATAKRLMKSLEQKKYLAKLESNPHEGNLYFVLRPFLSSAQKEPMSRIHLIQPPLKTELGGSKRSDSQIKLIQQPDQFDPHHGFDSDFDLKEIRSEGRGLELREVFGERWKQKSPVEQQGEERVFSEILKKYPNDLKLIFEVLSFCEEKKTDLFGRPIQTSVMGMLKNTLAKNQWPTLQRTWEQIRTQRCETLEVSQGKDLPVNAQKAIVSESPQEIQARENQEEERYQEKRKAFEKEYPAGEIRDAKVAQLAGPFLKGPGAYAAAIGLWNPERNSAETSLEIPTSPQPALSDLKIEKKINPISTEFHVNPYGFLNSRSQSAFHRLSIETARAPLSDFSSEKGSEKKFSFSEIMALAKTHRAVSCESQEGGRK